MSPYSGTCNNYCEDSSATHLNNVCLFCFKVTEKGASGDQFFSSFGNLKGAGNNYRDGEGTTTTVSNFFKFVDRMGGSKSGRKSEELFWRKGGGVDCCEDCGVIVASVCEVYHEVKCLEMRLEWKLESLVNIMQLANKVPSRVQQVKRILKEVEENEGEENMEVEEEREMEATSEMRLKSVKAFRRDIISKCNKKLKASQPRVLIERMEQDSLTRNPTKSEVPFVAMEYFLGWILSFSTVIALSTPTRAKEQVIFEDTTTTKGFQFGDGYFLLDLEDGSLLELETDEPRTPASFSTQTEDFPEALEIEEMELKPEAFMEPNEADDDNPDFFESGSVTNSDFTLLTNDLCLLNTRVTTKTENTELLTEPEAPEEVANEQDLADPSQDLKAGTVNNEVVVPAPVDQQLSTSPPNLCQVPNPLKTEKETPKNLPLNAEEASPSTRYTLRTHRKRTYPEITEEDDNPEEMEDPGSSFEDNDIDSMSSSSSDSDTNEPELDSKLNSPQNKKLCIDAHPEPDTKPPSSAKKPSLRGTFPCQFCPLSKTYAPDLALHELTHSVRETPVKIFGRKKKYAIYSCSRCPLNSTQRNQHIHHFLQDHLLLPLPIYKCPICQAESYSLVSRASTFQFDHPKTHHDIEGLDPSEIPRCDQCPAYFVKRRQLVIHKLIVHFHRRCPTCQKSFKSLDVLRHHLERVHPPPGGDFLEKLVLSCPQGNCRATFVKQEDLKKHLETCGPDNQQVCNFCGKGFWTRDRLKRHLEAVHSEPKFFCDKCGKGFKTKQALDVHLDYHKGPDAWRFQCATCGRKFALNSKLTRHQRTHTKEKMWICQVCGAEYAHRHNWRNHMRTKHPEEYGKNEEVYKKKGKGGNFVSRKGVKKGTCILAGVQQKL